MRTRKSKKGVVYWLDIFDASERVRRTLKIDFDLPEKQRRDIAEIKASEIRKSLMLDSDGLRKPIARNFLTFFERHLDEVNPGSYRKFNNTLRHLRLVHGNTLLTTHMTPKVMQQWKDYLEANFNGETPRTMWACTRRVIKLAIKAGIMNRNPAEDIVSPRVPDKVNKEVLSIGEIDALIKTPMPDPIVCKAWMFCLYTGMGMAELVKLPWTGIDRVRKQVKYKRSKNNRVVIVDVPEVAFEYLPEKKTGKVFSTLPSDSYCSRYLKKWIAAAGIEKNISWYCARHTLAVLTLEAGADLLTLSKQLGHAGTTHTVKYLKLTDQLKRKAADSLPVFKLPS